MDKFQKFTDEKYVKKMLDIIGYTKNLFGKKLLENSCGEGHILVEVVERYIQDSLKEHRSLSLIKTGLETDIRAFEIDPKVLDVCIVNLNNIAMKYNIIDVDWGICLDDYLYSENDILYDYVVGNPPYITYQEIGIQDRIFLKKNFEVCKNGKFDYCYAFIEKSIRQLGANGKMVYLIPSSIFKNVFGENLRKYMLSDLISIFDYRIKNIFSDALTSSAIIVLEKKSQKKTIDYYDIDLDKSSLIQKENLGSKWVFSDNNLKRLSGEKFSDYFKVANSVATLLNKVFVLSDFEQIDDNFVYLGAHKIEKNLVRIAASPKACSKDKIEYIIFPYYYDIQNKLNRYDEVKFREIFPCATNYLQSNLELLNMRKVDNSTEWFEFGRSQALGHINKRKLLTSSVVTNTVNIYDLGSEVIPYSGFYITSESETWLDIAKEILSSDLFFSYINTIGINASGNSLRITVKDILEFPLESSTVKRLLNS